MKEITLGVANRARQDKLLHKAERFGMRPNPMHLDLRNLAGEILTRRAQSMKF
jgi:hypothetical protein